MLEQCCNYSKQYRNNAASAKHRRCEFVPCNITLSTRVWTFLEYGAFVWTEPWTTQGSRLGFRTGFVWTEGRFVLTYLRFQKLIPLDSRTRTTTGRDLTYSLFASSQNIIDFPESFILPFFTRKVSTVTFSEGGYTLSRSQNHDKTSLNIWSVDILFPPLRHSRQNS